LFLTREETFLAVGNRPANVYTVKVGAKKDGSLTALSAYATGAVGAYPGGATSASLVRNLYRCPNVRTEEVSVLINAGKERAFRAPGFPQCAWALEQTIDALAQSLGIDPVELRTRNIPIVAQGGRPRRPFTSTGLRACLTEGAKAFGWTAARTRPRDEGRLVRGVGVAAGMWGYPGYPHATAIVKLFSDGSVNVNSGASDIGTGTKTALAMVVAEELTVELSRIGIEHADTATTQFAPASGGSQTIVVNTPAVRAAAVEVKRRLLELAAKQKGKHVSELSLVAGHVVSATDPATKIPIGSLVESSGDQVIVGIGKRGPLPEEKVALPFAAQFAEVEVDTHTGAVRVVRMVAAHDSGRVINRLTYESQVIGGIAMGIGFALTEQRILDHATGTMVNANWHDYKIPTMMDVPLDEAVIPIDLHDTEANTTGTKGLGEPATIPTAAAIANAVYNATRIRMTDSPITPMAMLARLSASPKEA
jgi:xanthine dehydrogenase YagR molybdenum-binding subunit